MEASIALNGICMRLRWYVCPCMDMLVAGFSRGGRGLPKILKDERRFVRSAESNHSGGAYSGENSGHRCISTELAEGRSLHVAAQQPQAVGKTTGSFVHCMSMQASYLVCAEAFNASLQSLIFDSRKPAAEVLV